MVAQGGEKVQEVALTEVGVDGVGGELAQGAVERQGAETLDPVVGASVLAEDWREKGGGSGGPLGDTQGQGGLFGAGGVAVTHGTHLEKEQWWWWVLWWCLR